ncbi:MAG: D-alanyl-D-alanine carboxypeptidase family protein [bacterium]
MPVFLPGKRNLLLATLMLAVILLNSLPAYAGPPLVTASAAVLMDARTGTVLYAKEPYTKRAPASTTKILTGLLAIELGDLQDIVVISKKAGYTEGSTAELKPGERIRLEALLHGALLPSGNDACVAIAEHLCGSEAIFVELMNHKAKAIGAWDTNFRNPHGLHEPGHYTTAYDLALIARYALQNRKFQEIVRRKRRVVKPEGEGWHHYFASTNQLLWEYEGADGVKTGTTLEAGPCLVASATREGRQLISVVLNSNDRWGDSVRLLDYGFNDFSLLSLAKQGERVGEARVTGGVLDRVPIVPVRDLNVIVPREKRGEVERVVDLRKDLAAPLKEGEVVGEIKAILGGEIIEKVSLIATVEVPRRTIMGVILLKLYLPLLRLLK